MNANEVIAQHQLAHKFNKTPVILPVGDRPTPSPKEGLLYYDTELEKLRIYANKKWYNV